MYINIKIEETKKIKYFKFLINILCSTNLEFNILKKHIYRYFQFKRVFYYFYFSNLNTLKFFFTFMSLFNENIQINMINKVFLKDQIRYLVMFNFIKLVDFFYMCVLPLVSMKGYNFRGILKNQYECKSVLSKAFKIFGKLKKNYIDDTIDLQESFINFKYVIDSILDNTSLLKDIKFFTYLSDFINFFIEEESKKSLFELFDFTIQYKLFDKTVSQVKTNLFYYKYILNLSINKFINKVNLNFDIFNRKIFDFSYYRSFFSYRTKRKRLKKYYNLSYDVVFKHKINLYNLNKKILKINLNIFNINKIFYVEKYFSYLNLKIKLNIIDYLFIKYIEDDYLGYLNNLKLKYPINNYFYFLYNFDEEDYDIDLNDESILNENEILDVDVLNMKENHIFLCQKFQNFVDFKEKKENYQNIININKNKEIKKKNNNNIDIKINNINNINIIKFFF